MRGGTAERPGDERALQRGSSGRRSASRWLPPELAAEDARFEIRVNGQLEPARVRLRPFFDPDGERLRS